MENGFKNCIYIKTKFCHLEEVVFEVYLNWHISKYCPGKTFFKNNMSHCQNVVVVDHCWPLLASGFHKCFLFCIDALPAFYSILSLHRCFDLPIALFPSRGVHSTTFLFHSLVFILARCCAQQLFSLLLC